MTMLVPAALQAQPRPSWVSQSPVKSSDGYATLRWGVEGSDPVSLFRITEDFDRNRQVSYTDQAELRIYRIQPGSYSFRVEACVRDSHGYPRCGKASSKLVVKISEELDQEASPKPAEAPLSGSTATTSGPGVLRPGLWSNPDRSGHGWSFYWANRLALPESHASHGNAYDLLGFWYTYEAKTRYLDGPAPCGEGGWSLHCYWSYADYRPLLARLELVRESASTYSGAIVITRENGTAQHGTVTITFGSDNQHAEVSWSAQFKTQALSGTDPIELLAGGNGSGTDSMSHYAGLWSGTGATTPIVAMDVGAVSEAVEVTFFDAGGDPGWLQAVTGDPVAGSTDLCFYYVWSGYAPGTEGTVQFHSSGCNPGLPGGSGNRNGLRKFTGFESARLWVDYLLPDGRRVQLGSSVYPLALSKQSHFHRIWFSGGDSCQVSTSAPGCPVDLTWFTDGDYPRASVYAYNQTLNQRTFIAESSAPAVEDHRLTLTAEGTYFFELRMDRSVASTLIARSNPFGVTRVDGPPIAPAEIGVAWLDEDERRYRVEWQHADTPDVHHYQLHETLPGGDTAEYSVSPGSNRSMSFNRYAGPYGTYVYSVRACNAGGSCSPATEPAQWWVSDPEGEETEDVQFPWSENEYGNLRTNQNWNYALGYHFTPSVDGRVTHLGGFFSGTRQVKLFRRATGTLLAEATVSSGNDWSYVPIGSVAVEAGEQYTVAAYLAGSGASYRSGLSLPRSFGDITILGGTAANTSNNANAVPTYSFSSTIYGQADIGFVPDTGTNPLPPSIDPVADQESREGDTVSLQVSATDPDGTVAGYDDAGSLPPGLSLSSTGLISGTIAEGAAENTPYSVNLTVTDDVGLTAQAAFIWVVDPGPGLSEANPETPPGPAAMPSMIPSADSSRVGATVGTFAVDPSGNASYRIPILTAPGSGGMAPGLSIEYSSQGGNGPLGLGWSLGGVSMITRCKQSLAIDGEDAVRGITLTDEDRFCLDGQPLIAVSGEYGASGTEYRTEIDAITRIVSHGTAGSGPERFTAWRKGGTVTEFGATEDSRIEARSESDAQTVLAWAQNRSSDSAGNYFDLAYQEIVAGSAVEFVLDQVSYTGNTRASTVPFAEIDFTYVTSRPDATASHVGGARVAQSRLLTRIDSRARANPNSPLQSLRSYVLAYGSDGHGRRILSSVTECRDSGGSYCFPPTMIGWQTGRHEIGTSSIAVGNLFHDDHASTTIADITGDGRPDLLLTRKYGSGWRLEIAPALKGGGFGPRGGGYTIPADGTGERPVDLYAIDLDANGFQDLIYPTPAGWKARLSTGGGLGAVSDVGNGCCGLADPQLVRIMDFDGDGMSDLVTQRPAESGGHEIVWLRNAFSGGTTPHIGFEQPVRLGIAVDSELFPEQFGDDWFIDRVPPRLFNHNNHGASFSRPFDYDGDGAVDLLVELSQRYIGCAGNCGEAAETAASGTRVLTEFVISDGSNEPELPAGIIYAYASYYVVLLSDGANGFVQGDIVGIGDDCLIDDACNQHAHLPRVRRALPVDINGDGLADFAYQNGLYDWQFRLNTGAGFEADATPIAAFSDAGQSRYSAFIDLTGDGLPEFIYPSAIRSGSATWQMHENRFGVSFAGAQATGAAFGDTEEFDQSLLIDFTGDGIVDNLFIDLNSLGAIQDDSTRLYQGTATAPVNVVTRITDGFGAHTDISYSPLTDDRVYTRMRDSTGADWGGFPVYDLVAPIHVVSRVESSAPSHESATATRAVEYHYVGAKLQAGGRGFLGFGEVIAYDPQSGIRTNTRYRQDFPFVGLVADVTRALASGSQKFHAISSAASAVPKHWSQVTAGTAPAPLPSGTRVGYSVNQWQQRETVNGKDTWYPFIAASLEREYTLTGSFSRKVLTSNTVDNVYGNLDASVVDTYAVDAGTPFATQTTGNEWSNDVDDWHIGRLLTSSVTHVRGVQKISRNTSFGYDSATGLLTRETVEPGDVRLEVTTTYQLDVFGNRTATTVSGTGMDSRSSTSVYDGLGRFVDESRNAYGQKILRITQRDAFGNALRSENIDGVLTVSAADHMGRPFISGTESGVWSKTSMSAGAGNVCPSTWTNHYSVTTGGGQPTRYRCFDRLGREVRTATRGFDGTLVNVDTRYDVFGRVTRVSEPYFSGSATYWNRTDYDAFGRVVSVDSANGNDMHYAYDTAAGLCSRSGAARQTRTINGIGQSALEVRNAFGETIEVFDNACSRVSYDYDAIGNLVLITGADGAQTEMSYDRAGRKIAMQDPDKGSWQYAWNALGEMTRQLDSKNQAIDFEYDRLGRVVVRYERKGVSGLDDGSFTTVNSEWTDWNDSASVSATGKAQPRVIVYRQGENGAIVHRQVFTYDAFGRLTIRASQQDGLQLAEETTYDQFGRTFQQFDASGDSRGVRYRYNAHGYVEALQEAREGANGVMYQRILGQDARGNVTYMLLGNGVEAFAEYEPWSGRLVEIDAYGEDQVEIQRVTYAYDDIGNLMSRHDTSRDQDRRETFSYDLMNRLERVMLSTGGGAAQETLFLAYGDSGNILHKSDVGDYLYGAGGAGSHAVTSAGGVFYTYDENGNQVSSSDGRTISYTVFDQAARIERGNEYTEFTYGIGNQRIGRGDDNPVDHRKRTWYFGSVERVQFGDQEPFFRRYVGAIAIVNYFPATGQSDIRYLLKDHLGSTHSLVADSGAQAGVVAMHFAPFGARRNANWTGPLSASANSVLSLYTTRGFTGHEHADGLGIIHMNGRIYDPQLGRFLQADPLVQDPVNSQSLNRYTYVLNNPLSYTDPSGYFSLKRFIKRWGRVIVAATATYFTYGAASGWASSLLAGSALAGNAVATSAISGSIAGFVGAAINSGSIKGAVRGALAGAIIAGTSGFFGNNFNFARVVSEGIAGGASAEIFGGNFKDGLTFSLVVSSLNYANYGMRRSAYRNSSQHPGGRNTDGESAGLYGDETKLAGAREQLSPEGARSPCVSPAGGCQGAPFPNTVDQRSNFFGRDYSPGGVRDFISESFAGPHDWLRNHVSRSYIKEPLGSYDIIGNMRNFTGFRAQIDRFANAALIPVAAPFALGAILITQPPLYIATLEHFYQR